MPDITVYWDASPATVYLVRGVSPAGKAWIEEHLEAELTFAGGIPVEHRYIQPIIDGAREAGLEVARG